MSVTWDDSCSVRNERHSNGRTDITRLNIAFRNYANARNCIESILKSNNKLDPLRRLKYSRYPDIKIS